MAPKADTVTGEQAGVDWTLLLGSLLLLMVASVAAVFVGRRLRHEGHLEEAAGLAITLMVLNLLQLTGVLMVAIAIFDS